MNNINKDLDILKDNIRTQTILVLALSLVAVIGCFFSYKLGYNTKEREVLTNAQKVIKQDKTIYNNQDLEIIIFGEPQL